MLVEIERYLRRTGMAATKFGREVAKDPRLVQDIRNGREPKPAMRDKIKAYITRNADNAPKVIGQPVKEPEVRQLEELKAQPVLLTHEPEEGGGYGLTVKAEGYMAHVFGNGKDTNPYPRASRTEDMMNHLDWNAGWEEFVPGQFADDPKEADL